MKTIFKYFIETTKPTSKDEAIELFISDRQNMLDKAGYLKNEQTKNDLIKQLKKEYDSIVKNEPLILNRDNEKEINCSNVKIKECEFERVFSYMNKKYVYVSKDYILGNLKENHLTKTWDITFDNELTSIKQAS